MFPCRLPWCARGEEGSVACSELPAYRAGRGHCVLCDRGAPQVQQGIQKIGRRISQHGFSFHPLSLSIQLRKSLEPLSDHHKLINWPCHNRVIRYLSNREEREEGGTPDILGDVKLGLIVSLKQSFGASANISFNPILCTALHCFPELLYEALCSDFWLVKFCGRDDVGDSSNRNNKDSCHSRVSSVSQQSHCIITSHC